MMYIVPEHISKNKIFVVNRSELEGRIEPEYYKPSVKEIEDIIRIKSNKKLKDFIKKLSSGATPSVQEEEKYYSDVENGIPFLRVQNLQTNGLLNLDEVKFINKETHEKYLKRSQVSENDLLVKITGVGRMAIASVAPKDFVGNTNQHMVVIKTENKNVSNYLSNYLNLDIIEKLATRRATGATRPALDYTALKSIPVIENIDFSPIMNAQILKQQKEAEAKALLDSIDSYLLDELGITLPEQNNALENRIFTTNFSEITGGRIDPDYQRPFYKNIYQRVLESKYSIYNLKELTEILQGGKTPASLDYSDEETDFPIIKVGSYSDDFIDLEKTGYCQKEQKLISKKGDIFILSAAHQSEYVGKHIKILNETPKRNTSYVGELICVRANNKIEPIYLFALLKTNIYKSLINREKTGQTSHIYGRDLKNIPIPLPDRTKQIEIANNIQDKFSKAILLKSEAKQILQEAQNQVEQMIIG